MAYNSSYIIQFSVHAPKGDLEKLRKIIKKNIHCLSTKKIDYNTLYVEPRYSLLDEWLKGFWIEQVLESHLGDPFQDVTKKYIRY